MYNIEIKRCGDDNYGLLSKDGKVLEFKTEEEARIFGRENVEGKSKFTIGWGVVKSIK